MALTEATKAVNLPAGADLSAKTDIFSILTVNNVGRVIKATDPDQLPVGILAESAPVSTVGYNVPVILVNAGGIAVVRADGTVAAGKMVGGSDTSMKAGRAKQSAATLASGDHAIGIALEAAVDGQIFSVLLHPAKG